LLAVAVPPAFAVMLGEIGNWFDKTEPSGMNSGMFAFMVYGVQFVLATSWL
jgi:hypothetical protein